MRLTILSSFLLGAIIAGGPSPALADADTDKAIALFKIAFAGRCAEDAFTESYLSNTEGVSFTYRYQSDAAGNKDSRATVYTFFCDRFHNAGSAAFILKDNDGHFQVLSFAMPSSKWSSDPKAADGLRYEGLQGFMTVDTLMNGEFDPETMEIRSGNHESLGDYYDTYKFINGAFLFVEDERYEIKNGQLALKPPGSEEDEEQ